MRPPGLAWAAFVVGVVLLLLAAGILVMAARTVARPATASIVVVASRATTAEAVRAAADVGALDELTAVVEQFTHDRSTASAFVAAAIADGVPLGIAIAIGSRESGFYSRAVGGPNGDGSYDRGVMQLNSKAYWYLSEAEAFDSVVNVGLGCKHLHDGYVRWGTWEAAVVAYNHGDDDRPPRSTVRYLADVLAVEREVDRAVAVAYGAGWTSGRSPDS